MIQMDINGYKLLWDWEHRMKTTSTVKRPDMLENESKKMICIVTHLRITEADFRGKK